MQTILRKKLQLKGVSFSNEKGKRESGGTSVIETKLGEGPLQNQKLKRQHLEMLRVEEGVTSSHKHRSQEYENTLAGGRG